MSKAVCPSLALPHPIPTWRWQHVSDRPVVYNRILSFSIVDVTSELLVWGKYHVHKACPEAEVALLPLDLLPWQDISCFQVSQME
jgi:hypothetical protein